MKKFKIYLETIYFKKESSQLALELMKQSNAKKEVQIEKLKQFVTRFSAIFRTQNQDKQTSRKKSLEKITLNEIKPSNRKYPYINWNVSERKFWQDIIEK